MRIGIFGGSFNPPHLGHLNSLQTVLKKTGLNKIYVVPAAQNPLKKPIEGPTAEQRLKMTQLALNSYGSQFEVDDQEIRRGGKSYTIETIKKYRTQVKAEDLYLIIGMDKFHEFDLWKDYKEILTETNLIVTSRPGFDFPESMDDVPTKIKRLIDEFDFNFIELKTGRNIQFIRLQDTTISSTELRKKLRIGKNTSKELPLSVENYIKENKFYRNLGEQIGDFEKFTIFCGNILFSRKGIQIRAFDLKKLSAPSEFTLVASGTSTRHSSSLAENLIQAVKEEYGVLPQNIEGLSEGRWVVLDYGNLIIHLFYDFVRQEYSIEKIWKDGVDMGLKDPTIDKKNEI